MTSPTQNQDSPAVLAASILREPFALQYGLAQKNLGQVTTLMEQAEEAITSALAQNATDPNLIALKDSLDRCKQSVCLLLLAVQDANSAWQTEPLGELVGGTAEWKLPPEDGEEEPDNPTHPDIQVADNADVYAAPSEAASEALSDDAEGSLDPSQNWFGEYTMTGVEVAALKEEAETPVLAAPVDEESSMRQLDEDSMPAPVSEALFEEPPAEAAPEAPLEAEAAAPDDAPSVEVEAEDLPVEIPAPVAAAPAAPPEAGAPEPVAPQAAPRKAAAPLAPVAPLAAAGSPVARQASDFEPPHSETALQFFELAKELEQSNVANPLAAKLAYLHYFHALEKECAFRMRDGFRSLRTQRDNLVFDLLDRSLVALPTEFQRHLQKLAEEHGDWLGEARFPATRMVHSIRYFLGAPEEMPFEPTLMECGFFLLIAGYKGAPRANSLGVKGINDKETLEIALRLIRAQTLRNICATRVALSPSDLHDAKHCLERLFEVTHRMTTVAINQEAA